MVRSNDDVIEIAESGVGWKRLDDMRIKACPCDPPGAKRLVQRIVVG